MSGADNPAAAATLQALTERITRQQLERELKPPLRLVSPMRELERESERLYPTPPALAVVGRGRVGGAIAKAAAGAGAPRKAGGPEGPRFPAPAARRTPLRPRCRHPRRLRCPRRSRT